jgi:hypothetical protein
MIPFKRRNGQDLWKDKKKSERLLGLGLFEILGGKKKVHIYRRYGDHYSVFREGTNRLPLQGQPILKSFDEMSADREAVIFVQKGDEPVYDRFGCQKNLSMRPDVHVREISGLALRDVYDTHSDFKQRIDAGRALGYSEPRIYFHEFIKKFFS